MHLFAVQEACRQETHAEKAVHTGHRVFELPLDRLRMDSSSTQCAPVPMDCDASFAPPENANPSMASTPASTPREETFLTPRSSLASPQGTPPDNNDPLRTPIAPHRLTPRSCPRSPTARLLASPMKYVAPGASPRSFKLTGSARLVGGNVLPFPLTTTTNADVDTPMLTDGLPASLVGRRPNAQRALSFSHAMKPRAKSVSPIKEKGWHAHTALSQIRELSFADLLLQGQDSQRASTPTMEPLANFAGVSDLFVVKPVSRSLPCTPRGLLGGGGAAVGDDDADAMADCVSPRKRARKNAAPERAACDCDTEVVGMANPAPTTATSTPALVSQRGLHTAGATNEDCSNDKSSSCGGAGSMTRCKVATRSRGGHGRAHVHRGTTGTAGNREVVMQDNMNDVL